MSVDVTNPDAMPVRVRRRSRGARSATSSPALPTLLRVPDVRPPSRVAASEGGLSGIRLVAATAPPVNEAWADNSGEVRTEISMPHDPQVAKASTDATASGRKPKATPGISTLAKVKGKAIDVMSRCTRNWTGQLGTWGAIAAAVIACTLVVRAMKQNDFVATPLPELMVRTEETAARAGADQKDIEVTSVAAHNDFIASDTSTSAAGPNTESISSMSRLNQSDVPADSFYANSQPFVGASGPLKNKQRPSAPRHGALASTLPSDSPQSGVASNIMDPRHMYQQLRASSPTSPTERQTRYALNQSLPHSPFEGSAAPPDMSELAPNVTPVYPSEVWPTQIVSDNEHVGIQTSTPHTAQNPANTVASSPQSPSGYPTTDQSRYGSFSDLKRALIERKLERDRHFHIGNSRPPVPTRIPSGATGNLGTGAIHNPSGVYR